jgi:hypothetical protein
MKYFFHNIYGDAQTLIDTAEEDVIVIPFGWTEEIEQRRNEIINEIGVTPSSLPSVIYYKIEQEIHHPNGTTTIEPAHYHEFIVDTLDKPWTWKKVNDKIAEANVSVYHRETTTQ